ncbi:hypothetical protein BJX96DRAFT_178838 [Aspergillus floccosus]
MSGTDQDRSAPGPDLIAQCRMVVQALEERGQQLLDTHDELRHARAELANTQRLTETLFNLIERMWALLCSYDEAQGEARRQRQLFESTLDVAVARLDLQSAQLDCELLRKENSQLRELLLIRGQGRQGDPGDHSRRGLA